MSVLNFLKASLLYAFAGWAWRIPFILAAPLGLIGLYLRLRVEDTPAFRVLEQRGHVERAPVLETLRTYPRRMILLFGFFISIAVAPYLLIGYFPAYFQGQLGIGPGTAYFTNVVALLFLIACLVTFGYLSDVVGRKPIMIACSVLFLVLPVPAFMIMELTGALLLIVGQAMIGLAQAAGNSIASVVMVEQFPTRIRYTAASSSYNLALMLIGGTAPYVATYLVASTGNNLAPAFYVSVIALLSLGAILLLPETYRVGLLREGDV